jgi:hypothetical protein
MLLQRSPEAALSSKAIVFSDKRVVCRCSPLLGPHSYRTFSAACSWNPNLHGRDLAVAHEGGDLGCGQEV